MTPPPGLPERRNVALLRVSTSEQDVASQREDIALYAAARGFQIDEWHEESITGSSTERPVLEALLVRAAGGEIARLFVTAGDRIGRRGPTTALIQEELHAYGVEIHASQEGGKMDLESPDGELLNGIKALISRAFLRTLSRKTKAGLNGWRDPATGEPVQPGTPGAVRVAVRSGKKLGRPAWSLPPDVLVALKARWRGGETLDELMPSVAGQGIRLVRGVEERGTPCRDALHGLLGPRGG